MDIELISEKKDGYVLNEHIPAPVERVMSKRNRIIPQSTEMGLRGWVVPFVISIT